MNTAIIHLAWKNVWRSRLRSGIIIGAIAIGLFAGTFITSFMSGWIFNSIVTDIKNQSAYVQIHNPNFIDSNDINAYYMQDDVNSVLNTVPEVSGYTNRLNLTVMLSSASNVTGVAVKAVHVNDEKTVSTIALNIKDTDGSFLGDEIATPIVISSKTAEHLKVRLKSKIILTFQDTTKETQSIAMRVGGIFKSSNSVFDSTTAFVKYDDILPFTGLPERAVHETALLVDNFYEADKAAEQLKTLLPKLQIRQWNELRPELGLMLSWSEFMHFLTLLLFLSALAFGIINTMLMAVLDRTKELGMLRSIGMDKKRIFRMIILETIFLTFIGSAIGILLAFIIVRITSQSGIDMTFMLNENMARHGFTTIVYPIFNLKAFARIVLLVTVTGILSAIYPALRALKLNPTEAMKN